MKLQLVHRLCLVEAIFFLLLARLALICLPFKTIARQLQRTPPQREILGEQRRLEINAVRRSIIRAVRLLPVRMVCFPRALAAYAMLRRRSISTTLYYGAVTKPGKGLLSHVWVQDGCDGVIGFRAAAGYKVIATYPQQ